MPLTEQPVRELLAAAQLVSPEFDLLAPNGQNYRALLLQPAGPIYADQFRVGQRDTDVAEARCRRFLELAVERDAALAVTPEYCLPWSVLRVAVIDDGPFPRSGALWALGCESITPKALAEFQTAVAGHCKVFVAPHSTENAPGEFFDPLAFLFQAQSVEGVAVRVLLIQFKTCPSRDDHFLEQQNLRLGNTIYRFFNADNRLSFATIVCSDAFAIAAEPALMQRLTHDATLLHIQLNPNPRHKDYRLYRTTIFGMDDDLANCDIICLNWAYSIEQYGVNGAGSVSWSAGRSTWYVPESRCSRDDEEVLANHQKGLYYTHLHERRHALLLNYEQAVFEFSVPKALISLPGVLKNKLGPLLKHRYVWTSPSWIQDASPASSGFDSLLQDLEVSTALAALLPNGDALAIERALALVSGANCTQDDWFRADLIDSCIMQNDEVVKRLTFAQDRCPQAAEFRHSRLNRAKELAHLFVSAIQWPKQVADLFPGAAIKWDHTLPHCNVHRQGVLPALIVFLAEPPIPGAVENLGDSLFELLRRENKAHRRRLCICYRRYGQVEFPPIPALIRFDYSDNSRADITEPLMASDSDPGSNQ
jgi:hypothetical protein